MQLPREIRGKNRVRDLRICDFYISGMSAYEIYDILSRSQHKLSLRRINSILSDNAVFINKHIGWGKSKRLHRLQRIAAKMSDKLGPAKDVLNVLDHIRTEQEGQAALVDASTHYHLGNMTDEQLIILARARGIAIPAGIAERIGSPAGK